MQLKKDSLLPDEDRVVRHIGWTKLIKDGDENVIGIFPKAFELRDEDNGRLSVSWLEYFVGDKKAKLKATKKAMATGMRTGKLGPKSALGIGQIAEIKLACKKVKPPVRIVYDPDDNIAHSSIINFPRDDTKILETLAADVFTEYVQVKDI